MGNTKSKLEPETLRGTERYISVFDLFKIGIGPSSSHSVGPMRAAGLFVEDLESQGKLAQTARIRIHLYGSLALTGVGHGTDIAVLMGLSGECPESIDPALTADRVARIRNERMLPLAGKQAIEFVENTDLIFHRTEFLDFHPNGLTFQAFESSDQSEPIEEVTFFSVGGGFVVRQGRPIDCADDKSAHVPYPFSSAQELLGWTQTTGKPFSQISMENELVFRSESEIKRKLRGLWETMQKCVHQGCRNTGILPGGLNVPRRAPALHQTLLQRAQTQAVDPLSALDWVDLYALAVNEENAAGGRVVTAPTNGAAGIIPAVLHYFNRFCPEAAPDAVERFLLTASVIGALYKMNASISGAEVGCQGEVGVACSMAAGALTEVRGGSPGQVEQAAEIGMEHNLGLTCDPIRGLVQIPCIERNAMGAVKAINASRMAMRSSGTHIVSLDRVIRVMKRTGADMSSRYKETSRGGLAVNVSEC